VFAAYTLLKSDIHVRPGGIDLNNALNETSDPQQQVSLRSSFDLGKNIDFDANLRWVDTLRNNNNGTVGTVPSYAELDVRVACRLTPNLELALVGQNLLDRHHPEFGVPAATRVELNRGFYVKATWRY
jgi:iron complex outermembrane receptor protein